MNTPLKLGYVLVYVGDVEASLAFFERAFGLARRFVVEGGDYGELDTGGTALGFVRHEVARGSVSRYVAAGESDLPLGMEVALIASDVGAACERAVAAGASLVYPPTSKPWGQTVAYVRAPDGTLVELCTAMS
jgi:lactoylglutathione lyase